MAGLDEAGGCPAGGRARPAGTGAGASPQAISRGDDVHRHPGHRAKRRRRPGDRGVDHQAGRRDPRLSADPAGSRARPGGGSRAVERLQPRALVRAVLREPQERAERGRHRGHRTDGHRRGPLLGQAQPARVDVARATRSSMSRTSARRWPNTIRRMPRSTTATRRPIRRASRRSTSRCAARLAAIPESQRWLVSSEGAFSYLIRDYNMREAYLWPINADEQGTPQQVRKVIDLVRRNKIPVVFSESTISDRAAKQVARETGARYGGVLYVDSLSAAGGPVPTYLDLLNVTVETIARDSASDRARAMAARRSAGAGAARREPVAARPQRDLSQRPYRRARRVVRSRSRHDLRAGRGQRQRQIDDLQGDHGAPSAVGRRGAAVRHAGRAKRSGTTSSPMCRRARTSTGTFRCWSKPSS